jgi:UDPglucose--hexose-1-phosphate uridylyltransferase
MEIRKHYFLDQFVIIADERAKRPDQFKKEEIKKENLDEVKKKCFFCPGNENLTPPEIYRVKENENFSNKVNNKDISNWKIRVIPNKFPFLRPEGQDILKTDNKYYTYANPYGYHEVIIDSNKHEKGLANLNSDEIKEILKVYQKRINELEKDSKVRYVQIFKNWKGDAGASIEHSHTQLAAYNLIPIPVLKKENKTKELGYCPYCEIIESEKNSYRRCFENNSMIAFTPYASRFPFEVWIMPKNHKKRFDDFSEDNFRDLSELLLATLKKLDEIDAPYNFFIYYGLEDMHFHIEIIPRLTKWAGFEYATETIINIMSPEDAAKFYRGE